jgi:5-formyltetrahydrofolate cyclo-ligase
MEDEVDLESLFDRLPGWRWVLPRVEPDRSLTFRDREVSREIHSFGMPQPADQGPVTPIAEIDVFLVPGLSFDERGGRLGRGAGFYDSILKQKRTDTPSVGVTVQEKIIEAVPMDHYDQPVLYLADEAGVRACLDAGSSV